MIKTRHLGGLATEQHAAILATAVGNPFDNAAHCFRGQFSRSDVIEKEKRSRTLDENVVDAVVDEIATDCVVNAGCKSDLELGPYSVSGCYQHRLSHFGK